MPLSRQPTLGSIGEESELTSSSATFTDQESSIRAGQADLEQSIVDFCTDTDVRGETSLGTLEVLRRAINALIGTARGNPDLGLGGEDARDVAPLGSMSHANSSHGHPAKSHSTEQELLSHHAKLTTTTNAFVAYSREMMSGIEEGESSGVNAIEPKVVELLKQIREAHLALGTALQLVQT